MATILIKEVRFLKVSIAKNPDAGLKESLSDLEQSKEEVEEALVDSDLDVGRSKEVLAKAAKVLKKYKNKDTWGHHPAEKFGSYRFGKKPYAWRPEVTQIEKE